MVARFVSFLNKVLDDFELPVLGRCVQRRVARAGFSIQIHTRPHHEDFDSFSETSLASPVQNIPTLLVARAPICLLALS